MTKSFKLTSAQEAFIFHLVRTGRMDRPGGTSNAGRRAANWDRTVSVLERHGLVIPYRRRRYGVVWSVTPAYPLPAELDAPEHEKPVTPPMVWHTCIGDTPGVPAGKLDSGELVYFNKSVADLYRVVEVKEISPQFVEVTLAEVSTEREVTRVKARKDTLWPVPSWIWNKTRKYRRD